MNEIIVVGCLISNTGKEHQRERVYSLDGISCTISATSHKDPRKL